MDEHDETGQASREPEADPEPARPAALSGERLEFPSPEVVAAPPAPPARPDPRQRLEAVWVGAQVFVSSMSIRYKIAGALIAVLCLAIASLGLVSFRQQERTLREEMARRAEVLARQLGASGKSALLTKEELGVYSTIKEVEKFPDVTYAAVHDSKGRFFAHSAIEHRGDNPNTPIDRTALEAESAVFQETVWRKQRVLDAAVPITAKYAGKELRVGTARVGLSQTSLDSAVRRQKWAFFWITSAFVLLGLLISFALGKVLTRQILILMTGMKVVAQGNLDNLVEVRAQDEIGKLTETFNEMILKLREKLHMEKYLSSSTMQMIRSLRDDSAGLKLGGERRRVTVLFSDIRGFTSLTETLDPEEVVTLLNIYLNLQAEVVYSRGGVVDKFVGDEVMALFTGKEGEYQALLAAQEILSFVKSLNEAREHAGKRQIWVGIGVNDGEVIMANMGSERQMDYTAIGDPINAAARLCSAAKAGQVVLARSVAEVVNGRCRVKELPPITVKGKKDPLAIDELLDVPGARPAMRRPLDLMSSLKLAGLDEAYPVEVKELGPDGCAIESPVPVAQGARIGLEMAVPRLGAQSFGGTVKTAGRKGGRYHADIAFEGLALESRYEIVEWVHNVVTQIGRVGAALEGPA